MSDFELNPTDNEGAHANLPGSAAIELHYVSRINTFGLTAQLDSTAEKEAWKYRATHDALTQTLNLDGLQLELERFMQQGEAVAVLFVDGDNIKAINDKLGHKEGDKAIQGTARALESCLREEDVVARVGGDEFVVLLSSNYRSTTKDQQISPEERIEYAEERITESLAQFRLQNPQFSILDLSIGHGIWHPTDSTQTFNEIKAAADSRMYQTKDDKEKQALTRAQRFGLKAATMILNATGVAPHKAAKILRSGL